MTTVLGGIRDLVVEICDTNRPIEISTDLQGGGGVGEVILVAYHPRRRSLARSNLVGNLLQRPHALAPVAHVHLYLSSPCTSLSCPFLPVLDLLTITSRSSSSYDFRVRSAVLSLCCLDDFGVSFDRLFRASVVILAI
ncbi:hypothetical protein CRG98_025073 [Punica granatum]|uniref:Uncharacterized protein n=1 Tax=Punica granatum TaxID=22663 RepID=A0A2I0JEA9_PUNGR|nr:hypothetical protein CRG98_025073 [Punica granatum]